MKIKNISVTVTYSVALGNVNMPKDVYQEMSEAFANGDEIANHPQKYSKASQWCIDHMRERDCFEWKYEITDLSK